MELTHLQKKTLRNKLNELIGSQGTVLSIVEQLIPMEIRNADPDAPAKRVLAMYGEEDIDFGEAVARANPRKLSDEERLKHKEYQNLYTIIETLGDLATTTPRIGETSLAAFEARLDKARNTLIGLLGDGGKHIYRAAPNMRTRKTDKNALEVYTNRLHYGRQTEMHLEEYAQDAREISVGVGVRLTGQNLACMNMIEIFDEVKEMLRLNRRRVVNEEYIARL